MSSGGGETCVLNEQAAAYVLHALEPDQEILVRAHLPGCRSCLDAVHDTELVARGLAESVEQVDPPPGLRTYILAVAGQVPGRAPAPGRLLPDPPARDRPRPAGRPPASRDRARNRRSGDAGRRRFAVAFAVVAALVIGGVAGYAAQLHETDTGATQALEDVVTELDGPGTTHATLRTGAGEPVATVLAGATDRTVVVSGLRPNDDTSSTYVVWGIGAGNPRPIGSFDVTGSDPSVHALDPVPAGRPFSGYSISVEPGRAAPPAPTTVVATGQVVA